MLNRKYFKYFLYTLIIAGINSISTANTIHIICQIEKSKSGLVLPKLSLGKSNLALN